MILPLWRRIDGPHCALDAERGTSAMRARPFPCRPPRRSIRRRSRPLHTLPERKGSFPSIRTVGFPEKNAPCAGLSIGKAGCVCQGTSRWRILVCTKKTAGMGMDCGGHRALGSGADASALEDGGPALTTADQFLVAVQNGFLDNVKECLGRGIDMNVRNEKGESALSLV